MDNRGKPGNGEPGTIAWEECQYTPFSMRVDICI